MMSEIKELRLNISRVHSEHLYYAGNAIALITKAENDFAYELLGKRNWMPIGAVRQIVCKRSEVSEVLKTLANQEFKKLKSGEGVYLVTAEATSFEHVETVYFLLKATSEEKAIYWSQHSPHWRLVSVTKILEKETKKKRPWTRSLIGRITGNRHRRHRRYGRISPY